MPNPRAAKPERYLVLADVPVVVLCACALAYVILLCFCAALKGSQLANAAVALLWSGGLGVDHVRGASLGVTACVRECSPAFASNALPRVVLGACGVAVPFGFAGSVSRGHSRML